MSTYILIEEYESGDSKTTVLSAETDEAAIKHVLNIDEMPNKDASFIDFEIWRDEVMEEADCGFGNTLVFDYNSDEAMDPVETVTMYKVANEIDIVPALEKAREMYLETYNVLEDLEMQKSERELYEELRLKYDAK